VEGSSEHGNEPSGSIQCSSILEWLSTWKLLKKVVPWSWLVSDAVLSVGIDMVHGLREWGEVFNDVLLP
jgi:hypothetical protein